MKKSIFTILFYVVFVFVIFLFPNFSFSENTSNLLATTCSYDYDPVCGIKHYDEGGMAWKNFTNQCVFDMDNEGYDYQYDGECKDEDICVGLGGAGPNGSLGPNDPNKDNRCCGGLTLVTPPGFYVNGILQGVGFGTICAKVGDGICDPNYETYGNSEDCKKPTECNEEEYNPVCGVRYPETGGVVWRIFPNKCELENSDVKYEFKNYGECGNITCVGLGGAGPNGSLGPNDPNKDNRCCGGLTLVTPPGFYVNGVLEGVGFGTICAKVGDGVCDPRTETYGNSEDCEPPVECDGEYNPVCGFTYDDIENKTGYKEKTYDNRCLLDQNSDGYFYLKDGKCEQKVEGICKGYGFLPLKEGCYYEYKETSSDCKIPVLVCVKDSVCTSKYEPVCGVDGKTYTNVCNLKFERIKLDYNGKCVGYNPTDKERKTLEKIITALHRIAKDKGYIYVDAVLNNLKIKIMKKNNLQHQYYILRLIQGVSER